LTGQALLLSTPEGTIDGAAASGSAKLQGADDEVRWTVPPSPNSGKGGASPPDDADSARGDVLRVRPGAISLEHVNRMDDLSWHPRSLDDDETRILKKAIEPVLRDLAVVGLFPVIRNESREDLGPNVVGAWLLGAVPGTGQVLRVWRDIPLADRIVQVAEQFQEWARDRQSWEHAGHSGEEIASWAVWPGCPLHDRSHSLDATLREENAVWNCLWIQSVIAEIGELAQFSS